MGSDKALEAYEKEYLKRLEEKKSSSSKNNANLFGNKKSLLPNCFSCGEEIEFGSNEEIHAYFSFNKLNHFENLFYFQHDHCKQNTENEKISNLEFSVSLFHASDFIDEQNRIPTIPNSDYGLIEEHRPILISIPSLQCVLICKENTKRDGSIFPEYNMGELLSNLAYLNYPVTIVWVDLYVGKAVIRFRLINGRAYDEKFVTFNNELYEEMLKEGIRSGGEMLQKVNERIAYQRSKNQ
jgi:hypothetical protein